MFIASANCCKPKSGIAEATTGSGLVVGAVANSGILVPGFGVGAGDGVKLLSSMKNFLVFLVILLMLILAEKDIFYNANVF